MARLVHIARIENDRIESNSKGEERDRRGWVTFQTDMQTIQRELEVVYKGRSKIKGSRIITHGARVNCVLLCR